jgi:hypothetical protein
VLADTSPRECTSPATHPTTPRCQPQRPAATAGAPFCAPAATARSTALRLEADLLAALASGAPEATLDDVLGPTSVLDFALLSTHGHGTLLP